MKTIKISYEDFDDKYISNSDLDTFEDGEFIRIEINEFPSLLVIGQVISIYTNGKSIKMIHKNHHFYNSNKHKYPVFYFAITNLMFYSLLYVRNLPLKHFNRFYEQERFELELKNINLLFRILKNNENYLKELENYWVDPQNIYLFPLIKLAKEFESPNWEITDIRKQLFDILTDRLAKINDLYKKKKFKKIRDVGYEIHNVPEMLRINKIFELDFNTRSRLIIKFIFYFINNN